MLIVGKSGFLSSSWHRFAFFFSFCLCHHSQGRCWRPSKMLWNSLRYNIGNPTATPCLGLQIPVPQTRQQGGFSGTLHPAQELKLWPSLTQLTERELAGKSNHGCFGQELCRVPQALCRMSTYHGLAHCHFYPLFLLQQWFPVGAACWEPASRWRSIPLNPDIS